MRVDPYQIMLFGLACRSANVTINCWAIEKISGVTLVAEKKLACALFFLYILKHG